MAETFTILDDGETLITAEWVPDPKILQQKLLRLAQQYDNMLLPLEASKKAAIEGTEAHFDSQSDPHGIPWEELNPDYLNEKVKSGYPEDEILVRTGAGKAAATSDSAWFIAEDALWFDGSALPFYMAYHQTGTQNEHLVSALQKISTSMTEPTFTEEESAALLTGTGRGKNLPKREFIGFSIDDYAVFEDIWNTWFAQQFLEEFPGGSPITETGFNMLGEFPVMGRLSTGQPILRTPGGPRFGRK